MKFTGTKKLDANLGKINAAVKAGRQEFLNTLTPIELERYTKLSGQKKAEFLNREMKNRA